MIVKVKYTNELAHEVIYRLPSSFIRLEDRHGIEQ